jgi:hypothetical protein
MKTYFNCSPLEGWGEHNQEKLMQEVNRLQEEAEHSMSVQEALKTILEPKETHETDLQSPD